MENCIFCKIVRGELPSRKAYEDEEVLVFHDIRPIAPVHLLLIPKAHVASLADCGPEHQALLGKLLLLAPRLAREHGLTDGFRTMINTGRGGGQEVFHLHLHVFGGGERIPKI
ncbi:MAG: histidine triad nucleotide-binding protein [Burkholderiales bacterium]|jgi:histidine triad (HIT) family protein|nr:histidine triad nucleotide-binding protein [Burkholderiales bacterium]